MTINTKKVTGRRQVRYQSLDDLIADIDQLSASQVRQLGNWSPGQIYEHLARTMNASIDGFDFSMPAPVRFLLSILMKRKFLTKGLPAGFKSTKKFIPDPTDTDAGIASVRAAVTRQREEQSRVIHPGFGKITNEEWNDFHLRHAEMHMSFLVKN